MELTRPIILKLMLMALDVSDISDIEHRKIMQKLIYLLQAFGVNLLYDFRWDSYGTYSPDLAYESKKVLRESKDEYDRLVSESNLSFSDETLKRIEEFKNKIGNKVKKDPGFGELLSSIHFASRIFSSDEKIKEFIQKYKPHLYNRYDEAKSSFDDYLK